MSTEETTANQVIQDPYEVLRVSKIADDETIKARYYVLVKMYSPEYYPDEFIQIRNAYDALREPAERAKADINLFNPAPPIIYSDYPLRDKDESDSDHHLSLFKLNQELQQILGNRPLGEATPDEVPTLSHILRGKVVYYCDKERWADAEESLRELIELLPDEPDLEEDMLNIQWMRGYQQAKQGEWQEAGRAWFDIHQKKPGDWRLTQNLALVARQRVDQEHEEEWWRETLSLWTGVSKDQPEDDYIKALIVALHQTTGGRYLDRGEDGGPSDLRFTGSGKELGVACMQRGNWKGAVEAFESVLETDAEDIDLICQLGWAYLNINRIPKAFQMWNRAKKLAPEKDEVRDHLIRGNVTVAKRLREQRINNQALVHFKNAIRYDPENEEIRFDLAETYMEMRNFQGSARECERILEINSRHKNAKQLLRDAKRLGNLR